MSSRVLFPRASRRYAGKPASSWRPSVVHAAARPRGRRAFRLSFAHVVAASGALHLVVFGLLLVLPQSAPDGVLTAYTVRVVDASGGTGPSAPRPAGGSKAGLAPAARVADTAADAAMAAPKAEESAWEEQEIGAIAQDAPAAPETHPAPEPPAAPRPAAPALAVDPSGAANATSSGVPSVQAEALDAGFDLAVPVNLGYPDAARRARKAGRVRLELEIGPDGRVLKVRVLEATPGWGFAESARSAYAQARFSPPRWQGRPVRVLWRKTLLFQP